MLGMNDLKLFLVHVFCVFELTDKYPQKTGKYPLFFKTAVDFYGLNRM